MPFALSERQSPSGVLAIQASVLVFNLLSSIAIITVNKHTFRYFQYPAALTCVHYAFSWLGTEPALFYLYVPRVYESLSREYIPRGERRGASDRRAMAHDARSLRPG